MAQGSSWVHTDRYKVWVPGSEKAFSSPLGSSCSRHHISPFS